MNRVQGEDAVMEQQTGLARLHQAIVTRRCRACRNRYRRRLPNCPVCKTKPGHANDPVRDPNWAGGIGLVAGGGGGAAGGGGGAC